MSGAQDQRRQTNIEKAETDLDGVLAPYRLRQAQLREEIADSNVDTPELQDQLDAVTEEIGKIMEGSLWWQLYQKD